jgi:hypothetical protein
VVVALEQQPVPTVLLVAIAYLAQPLLMAAVMVLMDFQQTVEMAVQAVAVHLVGLAVLQHLVKVMRAAQVRLH